ncbi:hypothetical protein CLV84_0951 [Neolewinella xylanilytica]|uniref:PLD phosphodiesterase domain-containing protein n=1 Tax=Neolewinella xylanilytica TaxID=1514080 RepID=A0A2S6I940_9BACT|nr:hypothetical protein [Neolewinella xylanilytica]PPK87989.1 hypothetical protein CLV84_0951 [Neolewinella xylanilytica]
MPTILKLISGFLPRSLRGWWKRRKDAKELQQWEESGQPVPPPHAVKQRTIRSVHQRFPYTTFVETGTFMGDMVEAQRKHFARIFSVELSKPLFIRAVKRFRGDNHITILQGDSGKVLRSVVPELQEPAIFWLDGHYSGGVTALGESVSPILAEIETILSDTLHDHVLLIDDARLFVGDENYPDLETVTALVHRLDTNYRIDITEDCICVTPQ